MNFSIRSAPCLIILFAMTACSQPDTTRGVDPSEPKAVADARAFIARHDAEVAPLEIALNRAWWAANTTGTKDSFKAKVEAQKRLDAALSDRARFECLEKVRGALGTLKADPLVARQIEVLRLQYLEKQVDPALLEKMAEKANAIEEAFNVYRARVDGKDLADSEVRKVLKESRDGVYRKAVWEASKGVGSRIEADLKELVKLRNESARKLGHKDFHALQLALNEQSQEAVLRLFDELWDLVREPFRAAKAEIDALLAKEFGIAPEELRPWHYGDPFFQEAPDVGGKSFDPIYAKLDVLKLCRDYYAGIGLPVGAIIERSDLFEKPGKNPHAFSSDIDRAGDVRVLANVVPTEYWAGTMLHELGHAVYSDGLPKSLPYVLRIEANPLTTEGIAMMFERFAKSPGWLEAMGVAVPDRADLEAAGARMTRHQLLIFAAWAQVMFRFEMALYGNPEGDANKLWWDLVEKYQGIRRPDDRSAPDYGAKLHIVSAPCYYHNYQMGQLFASQVHHTIARDVLKTAPRTALYNGRKDVGEFLKAKVFGPGRSVDWNGLARLATGDDLSAKAFAEDLKGE
jgi:peptidyl-dipeptidase A